MQELLGKLDWNHLLSVWGLGVLTWLGVELRQWRIWWQNQHGGAPDAPPPTEPTKAKEAKRAKP